MPSFNTNKQNLLVWSWLSDFVACGESVYIWSRVSYVPVLERNGNLKFSM